MKRTVCVTILLSVLAFGRVAGVTVEGVLATISAATYEQAHVGLFVANGMNRGFTGDLDGNIPRVPAYQHDEARDLIVERFEAYGLETSLDPFAFTRAYGAVTYTYTNCNSVIALQRGVATNAGWYIIGAHYDTVDPGQFQALSPGADDNASGVAAVLELARALSHHVFRDHILYIAFDAEEKGLKGAWHFVDTHTTDDSADTHRIPRDGVRGMISLDMLAFNPVGPDANKIRIYGGSSSSNAPVQAALREAFLHHTAMAVTHSGAISASDHYPFHARGMSACLLIEYNVWSNPHYHKATDATDTVDYLDYDYAAELTRGVGAYLLREAGVLLPPSVLADKSPERELVTLQWTAQSNAVYRVSTATALMPTPDWSMQAIVTNHLGQPTLEFEGAVDSAPGRYYRVEHLYEP